MVVYFFFHLQSATAWLWHGTSSQVRCTGGCSQCLGRGLWKTRQQDVYYMILHGCSFVLAYVIWCNLNFYHYMGFPAWLYDMVSTCYYPLATYQLGMESYYERSSTSPATRIFLLMPPGPTILLESCPISWPKRQVFKDGPMAHASILPGTRSYRLTLTLPDVHALVGTGEWPCNSTYSKYFTGVIHQYSSYFPKLSDQIWSNTSHISYIICICNII